MNKKLKEIQDMIDKYKKENPEESVGELSDTYHTFDELYDHRAVLTALAFRCLPYAWKSRKHEDGTMFDGMFIVGAPTPDGMITYHYDNEYWDLFRVPEISRAPKFDGHTPEDVIKRISNYITKSGTHILDNDMMEKLSKIASDEILSSLNPIDAARFIAFYSV